jgi:hypothetical protein
MYRFPGGNAGKNGYWKNRIVMCDTPPEAFRRGVVL